MKFGQLLACVGMLVVEQGAAASAPTPQLLPCATGSGRSAISLTVSGLKQQSGIINIFVYGGRPQDWLSKDRRVARLWYDAPPAGDFHLCIPVPADGRYGLVVHHDANRDLKRDAGDGIGYSRNPQLSIFRLKPRYGEAAITVKGATAVDIALQYRSGLSVRPISSGKR